MQRSGDMEGGAPRHDPVRETVHDLRNLFAVIASIRHLLDKHQDGPERQTMLRGLEEAAVRGNELTSRLLARQKAGQCCPMDVGAQVAHAAPLLHAIAPRHGEPPGVIGDRHADGLARCSGKRRPGRTGSGDAGTGRQCGQGGCAAYLAPLPQDQRLDLAGDCGRWSGLAGERRCATATNHSGRMPWERLAAGP